MKSDLCVLFEQLESRTLLSVSVTDAASSAAATNSAAVVASAAPNASTGVGLKIHVIAGDPFTSEVAFYPLANPTGGYVATINWGDDTTSNATLTYGSRNGTPGFEIFGSHIYAQPGHFVTTTTLSLGPATGSAAPAALSVVATLKGQAIVRNPPAVSPNGVTLTETTGQFFTAGIGTVLLPAVQNQLFTATINWGDGTTSLGQLSPVIGASATNAAAEVEYQVIGGHTYSQAGNYPVSVVVDETSPTAAAAVQVANLHSIIIVQTPISLAGTITGTYRIAGDNPLTGFVYAFSGTGTAGDLGAVSLTGTITVPGTTSTTDKATGRMTLTNASGSVTLKLTGPTETVLGPIPGTMDFSILSATGAYFDNIASGTIAITVAPRVGSTPAAFTFVIS